MVNSYINQDDAWSQNDYYENVNGAWMKRTAYVRQGSQWVKVVPKPPKPEPLPEPIAYLYNGVQLPPLPDWDKTTYPYAVITAYTNASANVYTNELYVTKNQFSRYGNATSVSGGRMRYFRANGSDVWEYKETTSSGSLILGSSSSLIWTNHNIRDSFGVYMAASEPVPVYE